MVNVKITSTKDERESLSIDCDLIYGCAITKRPDGIQCSSFMNGNGVNPLILGDPIGTSVTKVLHEACDNPIEELLVMTEVGEIVDKARNEVAKRMGLQPRDCEKCGEIDDEDGQVVSASKTYKVPLATLQEWVRSGYAADHLRVHDRFLIEFDGVLKPFEVIGIDAETLIDKELKHSVTLFPVELSGEVRAFDEDGSSRWDSSSIRKYLNGPEFASRFKDDIAAYTALVEKDTDGTKTEDRFFLLSYEEAKGSKYQAFRNELDRIRITPEGETDCYALRSAGRGNASSTWFVYSSGGVYSNGASGAYRFAQAFVIA